MPAVDSYTTVTDSRSSNRWPCVRAISAIVDCMASITIRRLDGSLKSSLRVRAAHHGRSTEEEAREILKGTLGKTGRRRTNILEAIRRHVDPVGGFTLKIPQR